MEKPKQTWYTGFVHITNENSFPGGRCHLILIPLDALSISKIGNALFDNM